MSKELLTVYILCLPDTQLLNVAGPVHAFSECNKFFDEDRVKLRFLSTTTNSKSDQGLTFSNLEPLPEKIASNSILIVPGVYNSRTTVSFNEVSKWIKDFNHQFKKIVSIGTGSFYLAKAGLLHNKECTTHHLCLDCLESFCPSAKIHKNKLFVEDDKIITSAGFSSGLDVTLDLIEKMFGTDCYYQVAKILVIYLKRSGDEDQVSEWLKNRNHKNRYIHKIQNLIIKDPSYDWTADELSNRVGMSKRNMSRVFKDNTGCTIQEYHYGLRIEVAKKLLINNKYSVERVAEESGFNHVKTFRRAWKNIVGDIPSNYMM
ncbi:GlxA family transcriptional regulator [Paraphotobacterium marinum]|nr:helix-turn-helix domain-containing protein [Paraphotobacterium marinum]